MELRRLLAYGSGVGIEIRGADLEIAIARVRPSSTRVLGRTTIRGFRERPAAEWGAEYARFLKKHGTPHLAATVLVPRNEVIVRQLALPGVPGNEMQPAILYQLDSLHPYGDEEIAWGWSPAGKSMALIGIMRRESLRRYIELFGEAGIAIGSFTFSAAAIYTAIRTGPEPSRDGFVALGHTATGTEVYGESPARPVFSAEFELPPDRAAALALSELRLGPEARVQRLEEVLPAPRVNPAENDLSRNALPYVTALAGACPRLAPAANLLSPAQRASGSRAMFIPTAVLGAVVLLAAAALLAHSSIQDRRYLAALEAEIAKLEPQARRAAAIDSEVDRTRARALLLDGFRGRSRADLEAINELTRLLPPPIWANQVEITRETANISGEADQSAPLLQTLDGSPLFHDSEFSMLARTGVNELFRIQTRREGKR
jgi:Tfp pilus assembly protein PilN